MNKLKSITINLIILLIFSSITLVFCEIVFRKIIFSTNENFKNLKTPYNYASPLSSDYWKLYYHLDGTSKPPDTPHPLLGWVGSFSRNSFAHSDIHKTKKRTAVLLYGDSYAQCTEDVMCFEDILNNDTTFSMSNYILNYGVGGYGLDQIYLLIKNSLYLYKNPIVIFSVFMDDLNRSMVNVRIGQKPYFKIESDSLVLCGVPINENPEEFFSNNPPEINSYLYNILLYGQIIGERKKEDDSIILKKKELNEKIYKESISLLRAKNIPFLCIVFHRPTEEELFQPNYPIAWEEDFMKNLLQELDVPYIWSKDVIVNDTTFNEFNIDNYIAPNNGHPTTHFNSLISEKIKEFVLKNEIINPKKNLETDILYLKLINYYKKRIRNSKEWLNQVKEKAQSRNRTLEEMLIIDAKHMAEIRLKSVK